MTFFYKTRRLTKKNCCGSIIMIELFDFVLGNVKRMQFDDERFISVEQQIKHELRDIKFNYVLKEV